MRSEYERNGFTVLLIKGQMKTLILRPDDYAEVRSQWKAGKPFFDGIDLYGDEMSVKLGEVFGVALVTPQGIAKVDEEDAEREAERKIKGDD